MTAFPLRLVTMLWLALLFAGGHAHAQGLAGRENAIQPRLLAETDRPAAGSEVALAIAMRTKPGWHGYWKNPGDAGTEPEIAWRLPDGVVVGPLQYPVPDRLIIAGLMNYVYESDYALLTSLRLPDGIAPGTRLPLRATLHYLACTDRICVPETAEIALDLTVGEGAQEPVRRAEFDAWRQALPQPLGSAAHFEVKGDMLRLAIPIPASMVLSEPYFFPETPDAIEYAAPQRFARTGNWLIATVAAEEDASSLRELRGVLRIGDHRGLAVAAAPGAVPAGGTPLAVEGDPQDATLLLATALLGSILGGLILNIMPCVFPILSLKALSLAKAGGDERSARRDALAYAAGVILVCLALGGLLLALRAGGASVGWAFQLQDPRVILLLLLLVLAITLNLAGLFELPAVTGGERLASKGGAGGAFWTGALAAFIATPCTGPFMGAALGAALVLPGAVALAIFGGLGFGLALPFLLLGFVPALRRRLPRPGPWMVRFRRWMAVPMALTAVGLVWVLWRQSGSPGLLLGLGASLLLAASLWLVGRRQGQGGAWLPLLPAAIAGVAAIAAVPVSGAHVASAGSMAGAQSFSEQRLAALRGQGRPVFLYFTADWCVTCKVNEKAVLERSEIARHFADRGVAVLVGDWTRGDPEISRFLAGYGRTGVPLYLYYAPGKEAAVLPQILTVDTVRAAIR